MFFSKTAIISALVACVAAQDRGQYEVAGLGARKQAVLAAGGSTLDLAIAMLETENMGTDYAYGDNKVGDAANFGIFKQNWSMLRVCATRAGFVGQSADDWNNGAVLKYVLNSSAVPLVSPLLLLCNTLLPRVMSSTC